MKLRELSCFFHDVVACSVSLVISENLEQAATLTKQQAYHLYGRGQIDRWVNEGLVVPTALCASSKKKSFDRAELEAIAASSNRATYLPVAER